MQRPYSTPIQDFVVTKTPNKTKAWIGKGAVANKQIQVIGTMQKVKIVLISPEVMK